MRSDEKKYDFKVISEILKVLKQIVVSVQSNFFQQVSIRSLHYYSVKILIHDKIGSKCAVAMLLPQTHCLGVVGNNVNFRCPNFKASLVIWP